MVFPNYKLAAMDPKPKMLNHKLVEVWTVVFKKCKLVRRTPNILNPKPQTTRPGTDGVFKVQAGCDGGREGPAEEV